MSWFTNRTDRVRIIGTPARSHTSLMAQSSLCCFLRFSSTDHGTSQSAANRLNGHRTVAFSWRPVLRPSQENLIFPSRAYPELRTCKSLLSDVIGVFTSHSRSTSVSPDMKSTPGFVPHTYQPPPQFCPHPTQHSNDYTHAPTVTNSCTHEAPLERIRGHAKATVVTQQQ